MNKKSYFRIMPGQKSIHFNECKEGGFVGVDYGIALDLNKKMPATWNDYSKKKFYSVFERLNPTLTNNILIGRACKALFNITKGIAIGDIILCPNGDSEYLVGEISGDYYYKPDSMLPHRRNVVWMKHKIRRFDMSKNLTNSTQTGIACCNITRYKDEIESLLAGTHHLHCSSMNEEYLDETAIFSLEKHLEDFLVQNWSYTELGKSYDIIEEEGKLIGQQFYTDTGPIDILAVSKDRNEYLIIELKRGKASDVVVGQTLRYISYIRDEYADKNQCVKGLIIALEDDLKLRRALSTVDFIEFCRYQLNFKLIKS